MKNLSKIGAVYCVYNEDEYIEYSIRSIYDFVDRIYVLLGQKPYSEYNPLAREQFQATDQTENIVSCLSRSLSKMVLIKGIWNSELEHRNFGLSLCVKDGMGYYFLVDGDEVYRKDHLANLHEEILSHPEVGQFIIKCHIFWRGFRYRIPADNLAWMPRRVFKLTRFSRIGKSWIPLPRRCRFIGNNKTDSWGTVYHISPERVVFYHFSYARSPDRMKEKLLTFSHAHEIPNGWFERVWMRWPQQRDMTNLNPTDPAKFPRILEHDTSDLPDVMRSHPYFKQEIVT